MKTDKPIFKIDLETLQVTRLKATSDNGCSTLHLHMAEYEAILLYAGSLALNADMQVEYSSTETICTEWTVNLNGKKTVTMTALKDLCLPEIDAQFAGTATYETSIIFEEKPAVIDLGRVEEACELFVNGVSAGTRIGAPYTFPVADLVRQGENSVKIVVQSNAAHKQETGMFAALSTFYGDTYNVLRPCGLLGPIKVLK